MLVRIAVGGERALSNSNSAANIVVSQQEFDAVNSIIRKWRKIVRPDHGMSVPLIEIVELPS